MSEQSEQIIRHILEPERFKRMAHVAKLTNNLQSDEHAQTVVNYEAQFFGARLSAIDLGKHQLPIERATNFFLEVIQCGMSFSPESNHVYLAPDFQDSRRLSMIKTADGNIFLAQKAGSISHVTKPVMVYAGEKFHVGTNNEGRQIVIHEARIGTEKGAIIAGYVFIVFPRGDREPFWMDQQDLDRLKAKSKQPQKYSSFFGGVDPGFFSTKLINHGLKNVRKVPFYSAPDDEDFETFDETTQVPAHMQPIAPAPVAPVQQAQQMPAHTVGAAYTGPTPPPPPPPQQQAPPQMPGSVPQYQQVTQNQMPWTPPPGPPPPPPPPAYQPAPALNGTQYAAAEPF